MKLKLILGKNPTILSYSLGFIISLILTILAFALAQIHVNSGHLFVSHELIIPVLLGLALVQLVVQLVFFLHILHEEKPRWNLMFFIGTFGLVLMIIIASILIMNNLNYNHKTVEQDAQYLIIDEGIRH